MRAFKSENNRVAAIALALVACAVLGRIMPHPMNATPLAATALLAGMLLPRNFAVVVPLSAMIISDAIIGFHQLIGLTWGCFALTTLITSKVQRKPSLRFVVVGSLSASVLFFVVTNLGVWLQGRMYAMTFDGLMQCYYNALPFFRNNVVGDLVYSGMLFGVYALVTQNMPVSILQKQDVISN